MSFFKWQQDQNETDKEKQMKNCIGIIYLVKYLYSIYNDLCDAKYLFKFK